MVDCFTGIFVFFIKFLKAIWDEFTFISHVDAQSPYDDDHVEEEQVEPQREEEEGPQREDAPQFLDRAETPGSQDTGYETNPDREYLDQGEAAMMDYPARDLPDDQLQRYRADLREMREDMAHE